MEKQKFLKLRISEELYEMFQGACEKKNKTMSEVLRKFSKSYTESDNLILLDLNDDILGETISLCKEKQINFSKLITYLLKNAIKNKDELNL